MDGAQPARSSNQSAEWKGKVEKKENALCANEWQGAHF